MKPEILRQRLKEVRGKLEDFGAQGILIGSNANRRWLSGFKGSSGWLLVTVDQAYLGTDSRYWEQAQAQAPHFTLFKLTKDRSRLELVRAGGARDIVFEAHHLTIRAYEKLQDVDGINWIPREGIIEAMRAIKEADEIEAIKNAAAITDAAMSRVGELVEPGMTEAALAWELEKAMREHGASGMTFPVIVASGPHASLPHHAPGDRAIQRGDVLLIDMGAAFAGYGSDLSRTFYIGEQRDPRFEDLYGIVARAQSEAIRGIKPGTTGKDVDAIARDIIGAAGYEDNFGHGLGHGLGLEGHEAPSLSAARGDAPLEAGMVTTVEPGIYIPGWGGIRIEDLVLITESGVERLSHCRQEPLLDL